MAQSNRCSISRRTHSAGQAARYDLQRNNHKLRPPCSHHRQALRNEYYAYFRCRKNQGIRDFEGNWGRNPGYSASYSGRSLMHGPLRRDPLNISGSRSCLCNERLARKNKGNAFSDNSQTPCNCHAFCSADRGSFQGFTLHMNFQDEPY
jgi:hypothetical protein